MKYSLIIPYCNRRELFYNTLASYHAHYRYRDDWEIIVIEDPKNRESIFPSDNMKIVKRLDDCVNPSKAYNQGVRESSGQFIILTSPEVYHKSNILLGLDKEFSKNPDQYVVAACESLKKSGDHHMWYQHSQHNNRMFHFCTSLSRLKYDEIGGFDENYAKGYCFDDDDFIRKIQQANIFIKIRDDLLTFHQYHDRHVMDKDYRKLWKINRDYFEKKWKCKYVDK